MTEFEDATKFITALKKWVESQEYEVKTFRVSDPHSVQAYSLIDVRFESKPYRPDPYEGIQEYNKRVINKTKSGKID